MSNDAVTTVSVEIAGTEISFETGKMAKQASGAVVVRQGDTVVLEHRHRGQPPRRRLPPADGRRRGAHVRRGQDPRLVLQARGSLGREGHADRAHDRPPDPPALPQGLALRDAARRDPAVDRPRPPLRHPRDERRLRGADDLRRSRCPTPVGAVRIGKIDGNFVVNPHEEDLLENTDLDLIVAGTEEAILMVEAGANEIPEAEILDALDIAHDAIKKLCAAQRELREKAGKPKLEVDAPAGRRGPARSRSRTRTAQQLDEATQVVDKLERQDATKAVEAAVARAATPATPRPTATPSASRPRSWRSTKLEKTIIRERIAVQKKRPDGRGEKEIRPITIEVGVAPRTHGSALFTRGQTQASRLAALGTLKEEMRLDTLGLETKKFYLHHYNFPPFSVGEAGFMRGPKRRDIGHGALAERALVPVIPSIEDFPYTIRVVSDILESNGSSSMASVCGSSLSLMDAGVPIKAPVAGIAMGLIKEGDDYIVLTDIAGVEDHLGDMDFKVAGTSEGITALQMDIKITGVTFDILRDALAQAKDARLDHPRPDGRGHRRAAQGAVAVRAADHHASRSTRTRSACSSARAARPSAACTEEFESQIDVNDEGQVLIYSANGELGEALAERITTMTKEVEVGDEFPAARSSRRRRSARSSSSPRAPTACCTSPTSRPASASTRSRTSSTRATRSTSAWSRSTASAAASACASPRTRRSPASRSRSSRPSAPAARPAAATAARARGGGDRGGRGGRERDGGRAATAAPAARATAASRPRPRLVACTRRTA